MAATATATFDVFCGGGGDVSSYWGLPFSSLVAVDVFGFLFAWKETAIIKDKNQRCSGVGHYSVADDFESHSGNRRLWHWCCCDGHSSRQLGNAFLPSFGTKEKKVVCGSGSAAFCVIGRGYVSYGRQDSGRDDR